MLPLITETEIKFLEYIKTCYERLEEYRRISGKLPRGSITASEAKLLSTQIDKRKNWKEAAFTRNI